MKKKYNTNGLAHNAVIQIWQRQRQSIDTVADLQKYQPMWTKKIIKITNHN